jgi:hypothetical protein
MKNVYVFFLSLLLIMSLATPAYANTESPPVIINLIAGKYQHAGTISVWDDGNSLFIMYETTDSWCLTETHLAVAGSLDEIPQSNGNPVPGQFSYKNNHNCVTQFLYTVPLNKNSCDLYISAHAVVKRLGSTETAWAEGLDFPGNNWGTYFVYEVYNCNLTPTPTETITPTSTTPAPTVTVTTTPSPTETATGTPSPTETATGTPTSTMTSAPTVTPTSTTPAPTITATPPVCEPVLVIADFSQVAVGQSVEGMGVVAPGLNIDAKGTAVGLRNGVEPFAYGAPNALPAIPNNGGLASVGGFTDMVTVNARQAHRYTFTFTPGTSVNNFTLRMLDYGDWNTPRDIDHYVSMTAYNTGGTVVAKQELSFTSPSDSLPRSSSLYGDLWFSGDAVSAQAGQPGNWTWNVSGSGIVRIVLEFGAGFDANIAFDTLTFTTECR